MSQNPAEPARSGLPSQAHNAQPRQSAELSRSLQLIAWADATRVGRLTRRESASPMHCGGAHPGLVALVVLLCVQATSSWWLSWRRVTRS